MILITISLPEERPSYKEPSSCVGTTQSGLAASFVTPSPKKNDGDGNPFVDDKPFINKMNPSSKTVAKGVSNNQFADDQPFINERKLSSKTVAKGVSNNGEHTLIPVTVKMIHSAVWDSEKFVLKDGQPLHMVKLVGAVRNFRGNIKHAQVDVEDGIGLVRVIFWRSKRECMAQHCLLDECNSNHYIRVIGEVKDYYGVHEIIAFNVGPVSSGNEVTHHFLEVAYSFEKRLENAEDEMLRAVPLV